MMLAMGSLIKLCAKQTSPIVVAKNNLADEFVFNVLVCHIKFFIKNLLNDKRRQTRQTQVLYNTLIQLYSESEFIFQTFRSWQMNIANIEVGYINSQKLIFNFPNKYEIFAILQLLQQIMPGFDAIWLNPQKSAMKLQNSGSYCNNF